MTTITVRAISPDDSEAVFALHRAAASIPGSGLARGPGEITLSYVRQFVEGCGADGVILGAFEGDRLLGEIHVNRSAPRQSAHVLGGLTVAVSPDAQGKGVGTLLFGALRDMVRSLEPKVTRVELIARSGNERALRLYERLGFRREGRFVGRVCLPDGTIEDDIPMALSL
jgi:ribosomal protein S18 acetylase RimI-like enzyme